MKRTRSLVHMLSVFTERLECDHGPPDLIKGMRLFTKDRTIRRAEHRDWNDDEEKRVERQRTLSARMTSSNSDAFKEAMLQRAYDLLWDGDALGCDALIEFLPSAEVDKMMKAWSDDQDDKLPRSHWYTGKE